MSMANASSPVLKRGIAPLAMGLAPGGIFFGTGLTSDCSGGTCANCSITGQTNYFTTGQTAYCLVYFDNVSTAANVTLYWKDPSGAVQSQSSAYYPAPPSGQYWSCLKFGFSFLLPNSMVGNWNSPPGPSVDVYLNGSWAGSGNFAVTQGAKNIRIDAAIKNTGTQNLNLIAGYMIDSATDWTKGSSFSLSPGQQTTITFNTTAIFGSHTLNTRLWLSDMTYMDNNTRTFTV